MCRASGFKAMTNCTNQVGFFAILTLCWCRAGGLKRVENHSSASVFQDSDPLVGSVYGICGSVVCVCGGLKRLKNHVFWGRVKGTSKIQTGKRTTKTFVVSKLVKPKQSCLHRMESCSFASGIAINSACKYASGLALPKMVDF